jgi:hypothetical protein
MASTAIGLLATGAAAGADGFYLSNSSTAFIGGDLYPIILPGIAKQLRFDAGGTIPDANVGDLLTLAHLQVMFGSGQSGISNSGSGATNYNLTNFTTTAYEVGQVPLPAGFPLLLVGLGAFGLIRRGTRRAA